MSTATDRHAAAPRPHPPHAHSDPGGPDRGGGRLRDLRQSGSGVVALLDVAARHTFTAHSTFAGVHRLIVDNSVGDVHLVRARAGAPVSVTAHVTEGLGNPRRRARAHRRRHAAPVGLVRERVRRPVLRRRLHRRRARRRARGDRVLGRRHHRARLRRAHAALAVLQRGRHPRERNHGPVAAARQQRGRRARRRHPRPGRARRELGRRRRPVAVRGARAR